MAAVLSDYQINVILAQAFLPGNTTELLDPLTNLPVSEIYVKVSVLEFSRLSVRGTESPQTQNSKLLSPTLGPTVEIPNPKMWVVPQIRDRFWCP